MLRRYELTDEEWNQIVSLPPPENSANKDDHPNVTVPFLTEVSGLPSGAPWRDLPERYGPWQTGSFSLSQVDGRRYP